MDFPFSESPNLLYFTLHIIQALVVTQVKKKNRFKNIFFTKYNSFSICTLLSITIPYKIKYYFIPMLLGIPIRKWRYSAINARKILFKLSTVEWWTCSRLSLSLCQTCGNGEGITWTIGTPKKPRKIMKKVLKKLGF